MRFSHLFTRTSKETNKSEVSRNAQLLTRAGYVHRLIAGVYQYLPLGLRVLNKIEDIIREEMDAIGGQEVLMPSLHPRENWEKTGRWDKVDVLYKLSGDRDSKGEFDLALGPTHEETVTPLVSAFVQSYRDLPVAAYQIQTKFRNEARPKSGLLRGREFRMKDMYSFHADQADLDAFYERVTQAYINVYKRCGVGDITFKTFATGGIFSKYSHEFQTLTPYGEDIVYRVPGTDLAINKEIISDAEALKDIIPNYKPGDENKLEEHKAIEVGNIFKLGTRFSEAFNAQFADKDGSLKKPIMGCYGLGPSRLLGTIAECLGDDNGLIWPENVAPYRIGVINLKQGQDQTDKVCGEVYDKLTKAGQEVIYDDRSESAGVKFADMDLIGIPWHVVVGPRGLEKGVIEVKNRKTGVKEELSVENALTKLTGSKMLFSPFERMVAIRYLRARRQEGFISVIGWFSLIGIALGVGTLIVVMSVMNGFRQELFQRILGLNGHFSVYAMEGPLIDYQAMLDHIQHVQDVQYASPIIEGQALVTKDGAASGVVVRGVFPDALKARKTVADHIIGGSLNDFSENNIAIGIRMSERLGVNVGDTITLISPISKSTPFGLAPRLRGYKIGAIFDVGMFEYDNGFVFMPMQTAQIFFQMGTGVSAIEVFVKNPQNLSGVRQDIVEAIGTQGGPHRLLDWQNNNSSFVTALKVERNVMFLILSLMVAVAALNIISSLYMLVQTKGRDIAILRTMGATRGMVMRIFFLNGASIGLIGTFAGLLIGLFVAHHIEQLRQIVQMITQTDPFSPEVYFLTRMPSVVDAHEVMQVVLMGLGLSFLATLYPSWRAARLDPVEALRYE